MYIVFLKFAAKRAMAGQWMAEHVQWIQQGIDDGIFLMAGSLEAGQGGVVLAAGLDRAALMDRLQQDPFVVHEVVSAEVHAVTPSRQSPGMSALLRGAAAEPSP